MLSGFRIWKGLEKPRHLQHWAAASGQYVHCTFTSHKSPGNHAINNPKAALAWLSTWEQPCSPKKPATSPADNPQLKPRQTLAATLSFSGAKPLSGPPSAVRALLTLSGWGCLQSHCRAHASGAISWPAQGGVLGQPWAAQAIETVLHAFQEGGGRDSNPSLLNHDAFIPNLLYPASCSSPQRGAAAAGEDQLPPSSLSPAGARSSGRLLPLLLSAGHTGGNGRQARAASSLSSPTARLHVRRYSQVAPFHWSSEAGKPAPRLLVVQPRRHPKPILKAKLVEALRLAEALGAPRGDVEEGHERGASGGAGGAAAGNPWVVVQGPHAGMGKRDNRRLHAGAYFGKGTIEGVATLLRAHDTRGQPVDAVFVNASLTGVQQRNLEEAWEKPVLDRVGLIIEIFGAHAETREAKLQVELASLEYKKSRLVRARGEGGERAGFGFGGEQQVVSARGRGGGEGRGFLSGAGESELQLQRRRIAEKRDKLKAQLAEVRRTRALHRSARRRRTETPGGPPGGLPVVAVVGYTNAGKSSLVAALSNRHLYADDRLFATLDPRMAAIVLPSGQKALLSDTVGFISDLPTELVEAFHATLEEVVEADLLLHVVDGSAGDVQEQREAVLKVLRHMGIPPARLAATLVEAWNKVDLWQKAGPRSPDAPPKGPQEIQAQSRRVPHHGPLPPRHTELLPSFFGSLQDEADARTELSAERFEPERWSGGENILDTCETDGDGDVDGNKDGDREAAGETGGVGEIANVAASGGTSAELHSGGGGGGGGGDSDGGGDGGWDKDGDGEGEGDEDGDGDELEASLGVPADRFFATAGEGVEEALRSPGLNDYAGGRAGAFGNVKNGAPAMGAYEGVEDWEHNGEENSARGALKSPSERFGDDEVGSAVASGNMEEEPEPELEPETAQATGTESRTDLELETEPETGTEPGPEPDIRIVIRDGKIVAEEVPRPAAARRRTSFGEEGEEMYSQTYRAADMNASDWALLEEVPRIATSALTGEGLSELLHLIDEFLAAAQERRGAR